MAMVRFEVKATAIRQMLDGMWVNTMVLTSPMRPASQAATGNDTALSRLEQKKKALAEASDRSNCWKSHSASRDWTTKPPANASRLNSAASLVTIRRDGPKADFGRTAARMRSRGKRL